MIYVVLGMHKSGTTLVARMLHASGIDMGADIDESLDYDAANHFERRATAEINRALLRGCLSPPLAVGRRPAAFGAAHRKAGKPSRGDHSLSHVRSVPTQAAPGEERAMRDVIAACSSRHTDWGFKDPRTCLTYTVWRPHLGEHKVIAVYRGVGQVLQHYGVAGAQQAWLPRAYHVLRTWIRYNSLLIEACATSHAPVLMVRYERLLEDDDELGHVSAFLERPMRDVRQNSKYRARATDDLLPPAAALVAPLLSSSPGKMLRRLEELRRLSLDRLSCGAERPALASLG